MISVHTPRRMPLIYHGEAEKSIQTLPHPIGDLVEFERNLFFLFPK
jgi:hypothetical protein